MNRDLFGEDVRDLRLPPGAMLLGGFARRFESSCVAALQRVVAVAPFRHMIAPGGYRMSVAMTNCGAAGWVTDRTGYRYDSTDPETNAPWPALPDCFRKLAVSAATLVLLVFASALRPAFRASAVSPMAIPRE